MINRSIVFIALLLVFGLFSFGCLGIGEKTGTSSSGSTIVGTPSKSIDYAGAPPTSPNSQEQILTKSSSASLKVPEGSLESKYSDLRSMLELQGGQISNVQYSEYSDRKQYVITTKVPPAHFDSVIAQLKNFGEVKDLSVSIDDVTKQYNDLNTRITNKEIELNRLRVIYNSTTNISDLLGVERELSRVESELELLKGEKQYLESQITRSSISIAVYEEKPATTSLGLSLESLGQSFFGAMSGTVVILALGAGFFIPFILIIGVLWFIWKKFKKKPENSDVVTTPAKKK